jgi:hypothetical protein
VFGDRDGSIFLADMSGDGLTDVVRIRHSEVCYWPNLGHGRFGLRVTLAMPSGSGSTAPSGSIPPGFGWPTSTVRDDGHRLPRR